MEREQNNPSWNMEDMGSETELDFNKILFIQLNRCNLAISTNDTESIISSITAFDLNLESSKDSEFKSKLTFLNNKYKPSLKQRSKEDNWGYRRRRSNVLVEYYIKRFALLIRLASRKGFLGKQLGEDTL